MRLDVMELGKAVTETNVIKAEKADALESASLAVMNGELVAFPTDTVYGLGVSAFDQGGIERLFEVKKRPHDKAIPVLLADAYALEQVAHVKDDRIWRLAEVFWPGPLTLVLPKAQGLPENISQEATIGVRVPDHPFALKLLERVGPMAVSSANHSGAATTRTAREVLAQLSGKIDLLIDGGISPGGQPSTVAAIEDGEIVLLREGPLTKAELLKAL